MASQFGGGLGLTCVGWVEAVAETQRIGAPCWVSLCSTQPT